MKPSPANNNVERRNYFRINDDVFLVYRHLPAEESPNVLKPFEENLSDGYALSTLFAGISRETKSLNRKIRLESPSVADYFAAIEKKLDMLARVLLIQEMGINNKDTREVNLSGGGVEFRTDEAIPPGCMLEMKFVVFPSHTGILAGGRVIRCRHDAANSLPYKVAVEFAHIREADRQFIIKHVLGKQSRQLRKRRGYLKKRN